MGGAYGHINHVFEDYNLTFDNLKHIIKLGFEADLNYEDYIIEKTDGMNLFVSWKNSQLICARTQTQLYNNGETSKTISELKEYFPQEHICNIYNEVCLLLSEYIGNLPEMESFEIFGNGERFISIEIINTNNINVIPYEENYIVLQNFVSIEGTFIKPIGKHLTFYLYDLICDFNVFKQVVNYKLIHLPLVKLNVLHNVYVNFNTQINSYIKQFNVNDSNNIRDLLTNWWRAVLIDKLKIDHEKAKLLINRWVDEDKSYNLKLIKKDFSDKLLSKILYYESEYKYINRRLLQRLEYIICEVGDIFINSLHTYLINDLDKGEQTLKVELNKYIDIIKERNNKKELLLLSKSLYFLNTIRPDKLIPSEGIIFSYMNTQYKFTGKFKYLSNIFGMVKFGNRI